MTKEEKERGMQMYRFSVEDLENPGMVWDGESESVMLLTAGENGLSDACRCQFCGTIVHSQKMAKAMMEAALLEEGKPNRAFVAKIMRETLDSASDYKMQIAMKMLDDLTAIRTEVDGDD